MFQWAVARMVTLISIQLRFSHQSRHWRVPSLEALPYFTLRDRSVWHVARMVTFTSVRTVVYLEFDVSVGCRPDGHFHLLV